MHVGKQRKIMKVYNLELNKDFQEIPCEIKRMQKCKCIDAPAALVFTNKQDGVKSGGSRP